MQYYIFHGKQLLLDSKGRVPEDMGNLDDMREFSLTDGVRCVAASVRESVYGLCGIDLRASYDVLTQVDYLRAGKAAEIIYWSEHHRYCGSCGAELQWHTELSKWCPRCEQELWPQLSPAIIVLIYRGDEILLVRSRAFKRSYYGLVAGFVELGESLEECVRREIREETNLEVDSVRYFGSQPWPYPQGLMVGFTACYKSGELALQDKELSGGGWFHIDQLPEIPKPPSMARKLIDYYVAQRKRNETNDEESSVGNMADDVCSGCSGQSRV